MGMCDGHGRGFYGVERCDDYRGGVRMYGKVRQLTGNVTVLGEM